MISKAMDEWDSSLEIFGERPFKDAAWLEGQRQGVAVYNQATGKLYEPSEEVRKAFEGDQFRIRSEGDEMSAIRNHRAVAALVLEAAAGDVAALEKLEGNDHDLAAFVTRHLDDEQRGKLAGKPEADVVAALPTLRGYGRTAREAEEARRKKERLPARHGSSSAVVRLGPWGEEAPLNFVSHENQDESHALRRYVSAHAHGRTYPEFARFDPATQCWVESNATEAAGRCDGKAFRLVRRPGLPWCPWLGLDARIAEDHALQTFFELRAREPHDWQRLFKEVTCNRRQALRNWRREGLAILSRVRMQEAHGPTCACLPPSPRSSGCPAGGCAP
ncbi:hypothetical protein NKH10_03065 [Mesorhizobium sp. M1340]|uniref:hypothetical protein n=1 Tax=Mesorhizobium sp. M1340 TaxID=2957087 RepID=UPI003336927F